MPMFQESVVDTGDVSTTWLSKKRLNLKTNSQITFQKSGIDTGCVPTTGIFFVCYVLFGLFEKLPMPIPKNPLLQKNTVTKENESKQNEEKCRVWLLLKQLEESLGGTGVAVGLPVGVRVAVGTLVRVGEQVSVKVAVRVRVPVAVGESVMVGTGVRVLVVVGERVPVVLGGRAGVDVCSGGGDVCGATPWNGWSSAQV